MIHITGCCCQHLVRCPLVRNGNGCLASHSFASTLAESIWKLILNHYLMRFLMARVTLISTSCTAAVAGVKLHPHQSIPNPDNLDQGSGL
ncbi:hypothetical protein Nepgr_013375 [Nepenthes gracilis]|uniref:Uncharacterized protein n=1 Tax=Nepenthes gracilis TaxID=150966 RepID=A0AAD3XP23_NEPGR|nr:hypothetical protein Nepgr_013375 [Nepenthes gracilis]